MPARAKHAQFQKRRCAHCGAKFEPKREKQFFCSDNCRKRAWDKKRIIDLLISILREVMERLGEA